MVLQNPKRFTLDALVRERQRLRRAGQTCVMTNGCFDLLHTGHLYFLQEARKLGDCLIVALNSDISVRRLKGSQRPVIGEKQRAYALAALACVDYVVVFRAKNLVREIESLQPDIYTKAGDYTLDRLHAGERTALEACGAEIRFLPFLKGFSTTGLIEKITRAGGVA